MNEKNICTYECNFKQSKQYRVPKKKGNSMGKGERERQRERESERKKKEKINKYREKKESKIKNIYESK
jgi:hypothetical protein